MPDLPAFARFWMVCRKPAQASHKTEPRQRYSTLRDARDAAGKLAAQTGAPFLILETVEVIHPTDHSQGGLDL